MNVESIKVKKTNKSSTPITFPKFPPYAVVGDYLSSIEQSTLPRKFPEWDVARGTPATELIIARRDYLTTDNRLKEKRTEAKMTRANMDALWKDLSERENALGLNFKKFNKFVKENQVKRDRAEKRMEEDMRMEKKRDKDIEEIEQKCNAIRETKLLMDQNIKRYRIYEEYLQKVMAEYSDFRSLVDILNRYESLIEAKEELSEKQENDLLQMEQARTKLIKLTEEKMLEIMGLQNKVGDMQTRFEIAKSKAQQWEQVVSKVKISSVQKTLELNQVKHCCWNIYQQMCARKGIQPTIDYDNIEAQLVFIKTTMDELKRVMKMAKTKTQKMLSGKSNMPSVGGSRRTK